MRSIAVINQKGGVGKTTSSVNLLLHLQRRGDESVFDLDPQAASLASSWHHGGIDGEATMYEVLVERFAEQARRVINDNLAVVRRISSAAAELELAGEVGRAFCVTVCRKRMIQSSII